MHSWKSTSLTSVPLDGYQPADGDHLCSIWTDPVADRRAAARFLEAASESQERLWILDQSRDPGAGASGDGAPLARLSRYSTDDVHINGGYFDPDRMRRFWADRIGEARARGATHMRAVAEMAWTLRELPGTEEAPLFESSLNPHLSPMPMSVICQYGSTRFRAETLLAMILSHPRVVIGEVVCSNPFSVDHERFPERFAALRADPVRALVPMWMRFLHQLPSVADVASFLCNSLPTFVAAQQVWVDLKGLPNPLALDVEADRVESYRSASDGPPLLERKGRLHTLWPSSDTTVGGAVQFGALGDRDVFEVIYHRGAGRIALTHRGAFARDEVARFATVASALGGALAALEVFASTEPLVPGRQPDTLV